MICLLRLQCTAPEAFFTGAGYAPAALTQAESQPNGRAVVDLPEWLIPDFQSALGADFDTVEAAMKTRAPVILRVNLQKSSRAAAQAALHAEGIEADAHPAADTALLVTSGARKVAQSKVFLAGKVELQDASSQAAIAALPMASGMRVLDYCAGGGGKLLAMAGRRQAMFFAHDALPQRMRDLPARAKRAGIKAKLLRSDELADQAPFDLIFCDVPCSGSGTWRRDPAAKWQFGPEHLADLVALQQDILAKAAGLLRPGGFLAYATCSVLRAENEVQIDGFLARNSGWQKLYDQRWSPLDLCDGFYTACLQVPA